MILLFLISLLFSSFEGEQVVFANDSKFNQYAVQISLNGLLIKSDTLNPQETIIVPVCTNTNYQIKTNRITYFGEYIKIPNSYSKEKNISTINVKENKMVTIHLLPQDIP